MMSRIFRSLLLTSALVCLLSSSSYAQPITDPLGDFLFDTYAGPLGDDLDVASSEVTFTGTELVFSATMAGDVGTTPLAFYVWGVDRGYRGKETADFGRMGRPNIIFDSVVTTYPADGTCGPADRPCGRVTAFDSGVVTNISSENITIEGPTITMRIPASLLPPRGLTRDQYQWNLWPRWGGIPFSDEQISDFAPDFDNAPVTVAP
jgi:hypothetical protein